MAYGARSSPRASALELRAAGVLRPPGSRSSALTACNAAATLAEPQSYSGTGFAIFHGRGAPASKVTNKFRPSSSQSVRSHSGHASCVWDGFGSPCQP